MRVPGAGVEAVLGLGGRAERARPSPTGRSEALVALRRRGAHRAAAANGPAPCGRPNAARSSGETVGGGGVYGAARGAARTGRSGPAGGGRRRPRRGCVTRRRPDRPSCRRRAGRRVARSDTRAPDLAGSVSIRVCLIGATPCRASPECCGDARDDGGPARRRPGRPAVSTVRRRGVAGASPLEALSAAAVPASAPSTATDATASATVRPRREAGCAAASDEGRGGRSESGEHRRCRARRHGSARAGSAW